MGKSSKMILTGAAALAVYKLGQQTFVPAPAARAPVAAGAIATLGAAPAFADKIDDAAKELDWTSDVYAKLPTQGPLEVLKAIDKMLVMGAAMDPAALKAGVLARSKAIQNVDGKGVTTLADYTAANAAIGHMVASAGTAKTMDVYNAFAKFNLGKDVGPYMMS